MAKGITYEIGSVSATMPTKTLARERCEAKAAAMIEGSYQPFTLQLFGASLFVWREPETGWSYRILHPDQEKAGHLLGSVMYPEDIANDRRRVIDMALEHFLDLYWDRDEMTWPTEWADIAIRSEIEYRDNLRAKSA